MKRITVFLLAGLMLFFCGCGKKAEVQYEVKYEEVSRPKEEWENPEFPVESVCVPDMETAIAIGNIILDNEKRNGYFPDNYVTQVQYDREAGIWYVHTGMISKDPNMMIAGSSFDIAIRESDGAILSMWVGE